MINSITANAKDVLAACDFASSDKHDAEVLKCVMFKSDGNAKYIVATNKFELIEYYWDGELYNDIEDDFEVLINAALLKKHIKASAKRIMLTFNYGDESALLTTYDKDNNETIVARVPFVTDGTFPNYKKLYEMSEATMDGKQHTSFNPAFMENICKAAKKSFGNNARVDIEFHNELKPIEFKIVGERSRDVSCKGLLMPIRA